MKENKVNVRWWDGYYEEFESSEVRFGSDLLWMRLSDGGNRHIPLRGVRWFSVTPESHENNIIKSLKEHIILERNYASQGEITDERGRALR